MFSNVEFSAGLHL